MAKERKVVISSFSGLRQGGKTLPPGGVEVYGDSQFWNAVRDASETETLGETLDKVQRQMKAMG